MNKLVIEVDDEHVRVEIGSTKQQIVKLVGMGVISLIDLIEQSFDADYTEHFIKQLRHVLNGDLSKESREELKAVFKAFGMFYETIEQMERRE